MEGTVRIEPTKRDDFTFRIGDSKKVWSIPKLKTMPMEFLDELIEAAPKDGSDGSMAYIALIRDVMERHCPGLVEKLTIDELVRTWQAYEAASDITVGE